MAEVEVTQSIDRWGQHVSECYIVGTGRATAHVWPWPNFDDDARVPFRRRSDPNSRPPAYGLSRRTYG